MEILFSPVPSWLTITMSYSETSWCSQIHRTDMVPQSLSGRGPPPMDSFPFSPTESIFLTQEVLVWFEDIDVCCFSTQFSIMDIAIYCIFCLSCIISTASCNSLSRCYRSRFPFAVAHSRSDHHTEPQVCNTSYISEFSTNYFPSISSHPRAEARLLL